MSARISDFIKRRALTVSEYTEEEEPVGGQSDADDRIDDGYGDDPEDDYSDYGDYGDDDYAEDDYGDDDYADDDYGDDGYGDYPDEDYGEYDEDYPEDYDEAYPEDYEDEDYGDEPEEGDREPVGFLAQALDYIDANDWVLWALLVVLPPVGVWLLWRNRRYTFRGRVILTALSAAWFIALLLLIIRPFRAVPDTTIDQQPLVATATVAPLETIAPVETEVPETSGVLADEDVDDANAVYAISGDAFYHKTTDCDALQASQTPARISATTAVDAGLLACPYCLAGNYSDGLWDLVFLTADTIDESGRQVYCSATNLNFHTDPNCSDISKPQLVSLKDALLMNRTACSTCCAAAGNLVYCTQNGTYMHKDPHCSGMNNASQVTFAEALVIGKQLCPKCLGGVTEAEATVGVETVNTTGYYVYATTNGKYYHANETCSGMVGAQRVSLAEMLQRGRAACPVCCPNAERTVYAVRGGRYYHSNDTCSGITNPESGTLAAALAAGYEQCPICWTTASTGEL